MLYQLTHFSGSHSSWLVNSDAKCNTLVRSAMGLTCKEKRCCHVTLHASDGEGERPDSRLKSVGSGVQAIAAALGRSAWTISRELQRNALDSGSYRPVPAEGAYLLRRQRPAKLERDGKLRAYVLARLSEDWIRRPEPHRQRQFAAMHDRARGDRGLSAAPGAFGGPLLGYQRPSSSPATHRADAPPGASAASRGTSRRPLRWGTAAGIRVAIRETRSWPGSGIVFVLFMF